MIMRQKTGKLMAQFIDDLLKGAVPVPECFMRRTHLYGLMSVATSHISSEFRSMLPNGMTQLIHCITLDQELILEMFYPLADLWVC